MNLAELRHAVEDRDLWRKLNMTIARALRVYITRWQGERKYSYFALLQYWTGCKRTVWTVSGPCNHYSGVGWGAGGAEISNQISALARIWALQTAQCTTSHYTTEAKWRRWAANSKASYWWLKRLRAQEGQDYPLCPRVAVHQYSVINQEDKLIFYV